MRLLTKNLLNLSYFLTLFFIAAPVVAGVEDSNPVKAICKQVKDVDFSAADMPTIAEKKLLKNCESDKYYYGIGVPVDYVKARKCAFVEIDNGSDGLFFGASSMLMMIYANGYGVKRNLDLAIKLACENNDEIGDDNYYPLFQSYIEILQSFKTKSEKNIFDVCDGDLTNNDQAMCDREHSDIAQAKREAALIKLTAHWTKKQKQIFKELQGSAEFFFVTSSQNETDESGDDHGALITAALDSLHAEFFQSIENFEKGNLPSYSLSDFKKSDAELNAVYKKIIAVKDQDAYGTVSKSDIRETQKSWIEYRDAWVKFGAIRYPQVSAESWKTWLTKQRINDLKEYLNSTD